MMRAAGLLMALALAPLCQAVAQGDSAKRAAVQKSIDGENAHYIRAFAAGDAADLATVYDADGSRLGEHGAVAHGRDAIRGRQWIS